MTSAEVTTGDTPLEEVFAERLEFEHDLISHRMTWLMQLNGFLVAATAVLVANFDNFGRTRSLNGALLMISTVGVASNASCYFSNFWGAKAIREAGEALYDSWNHLTEAARDQQIARMRLYGRDPRSFGRPHKSPPSRVLHPWNLLPLLQVVLFAALPLISSYITTGDVDLPRWARFLHLLPLVLFAVLIAADSRHHAQRDSTQDVRSNA